MTNLPNWMYRDDNHESEDRWVEDEMGYFRRMLESDVCHWAWAMVEDKAGLVFTGCTLPDTRNCSVRVNDLPLSFMLAQLTAPERIKFADKYFKYIKEQRVRYTTQEGGWAIFSNAINYG